MAKSIPERKDFIPNTFKAHFKQSYKSSLSGKEKVTKGYIEYFFPGRVRFEVTSPDKTIFVSNPQTTWYYNAPFIDGEPGEVLIKKTGKMVISKFFDCVNLSLFRVVSRNKISPKVTIFFILIKKPLFIVYLNKYTIMI